MRRSLLAAAVRNLPSHVFSRVGIAVVVPFALLTLASALALTRLTFSPGLVGLVPAKDPFLAEQSAFVRHFAEPSYITLLLRSDPLFSPESLGRLAWLQRTIQGYPEVKSVLSVASVRDLEAGGADISFVPLYRASETEYSSVDLGGLRRHILETPLFRKFLLSRDGRSFAVYVFPKKGADPDRIARDIERAAASVGGDGVSVLAFGPPVASLAGKRAAAHDLLLLGSISLLIAFLLESLFSRSLRVGAILLVSSIVPALWSLALFPLFGLAMSVYTVVVPLVVIALSTSYGIHLFRHLSISETSDMQDVLHGVAPVIVAAGLTTMLGFSSLLLTPIGMLKTLGLLMLPGILFAVITSIFLLPPILNAAWRRERLRDAGPRGGATNPSDRRLPAERWGGSGGPSEVILSRAVGERIHGEDIGMSALLEGRPAFGNERGPAPTAQQEPVSRRRRVAILILSGVLLLVLAGGASRVRYDIRSEYAFRARTPIGSLARSYSRQNGGLRELIVAVDSGREYGLVDSRMYAGVRSMEQAISAFADNTSVISFSDFVDWIESRLSKGDVFAASAAAGLSQTRIGEDLELLFSQETGLRIDSLVDPSYRRTRLIVHFGDASASASQVHERFVELKRRISAIARDAFPEGATLSFFGAAQSREHEQHYLVRSQLYSAAFFFAALLFFLLVGFRSLRWSFLVLLPPLVGLLFYFGILGWLGISFSPFTVFMVSAVMGVGNDDVLFFVLSLRRRLRLPGETFPGALATTIARTGRAIVQTTVVLAVALSVLGFSQFFHVSAEGLLGAATLGVCTMVTYSLIPILLHSTAGWWKMRREKEEAS